MDRTRHSVKLTSEEIYLIIRTLGIYATTSQDKEELLNIDHLKDKLECTLLTPTKHVP